MTLSRYFIKGFAWRFLATLLAFASLLQLLDVLDRASDVLERGHGPADMLTYIGLNLPLFVSQVVPLSVLIAALMAFMSLARHNEIVALRSVGTSPSRLFAALLPAVAVVVALHVLLMDQIAPRADEALRDWWAARPAPDAAESRPEGSLWLRAGPSIVSVQEVHDGGRRLEGVTIVARDDRGLATGRVVAREAAWEAGAWTLRGVEVLHGAQGAPRMERRDTLPWPEGPSPENVAFADEPTRFLSVRRLLAIVEGRWSGTLPVLRYETQLQEIFAIPISSFVMLLLAQPALHGVRRGGRFGAGMAIGLGLGLLFQLFRGLLSALAQAGAMPVTLAVWLPIALFACVGCWIVLVIEE